MKRLMLKSKIHRARVTRANLNYEGSITLCPYLMREADIKPYEQVQVYNITTGTRFETYAMEGSSGDVILNGAAARLVQPGDLIIVASYALYDEGEYKSPKIVLVDSQNRIRRVLEG